MTDPTPDTDITATLENFLSATLERLRDAGSQSSWHVVVGDFVDAIARHIAYTVRLSGEVDDLRSQVQGLRLEIQQSHQG